MSGRRAVCILVAGLLFVAAACGGDDGPASTTTAAPSAATSAPTTVATTLPSADPGTDAGEDRSGELLGRWEINHYRLPGDGALTNVLGDPVFIEFNADSSVDYNTGCNSGGTEFATSGTYYVPESALDDMPKGQPITIGPDFEQTERGCDGFLGDQDRDLPYDMGAATRFVLDGDRLFLLDEFGLIEATKSG